MEKALFPVPSNTAFGTVMKDILPKKKIQGIRYYYMNIELGDLDGTKENAKEDKKEQNTEV